ncbi:MAG: sulfite exporter TauE/SafE family protein [Fimbriimonas sp.]
MRLSFREWHGHPGSMQLALAVLIGLAGGAMSGLFGIGGGVVMVPAFIYLLGFTQHQSQGTSLAVQCLPVAIAGAVNYYRAGNVDLRVAALAALAAAGFIVGATSDRRLRCRSTRA